MHQTTHPMSRYPLAHEFAFSQVTTLHEEYRHAESGHQVRLALGSDEWEYADRDGKLIDCDGGGDSLYSVLMKRLYWA